METNSKLFPLQIVELEKEYLAKNRIDSTIQELLDY